MYSLLGRDSLVLRLEDKGTDEDASGMREGYEWKQIGSPKLKILTHTGKLLCELKTFKGYTYLIRKQ